jgi:TIR domain
MEALTAALQAEPKVSRDTLFVSHANPEDNEFSLWLSLQLAQQGYPVWCDLTKLLGGETFWDDIETAIRQRTSKFLYVLSSASNSKDGSLRELQLAQSLTKTEKLHDFVIPLHIDSLAHGDVTIELQRVNSIGFQNSWAKGLALLLNKLEEERVPRQSQFNPDAVNAWWRTQFSADHNVVQKPEDLTSNWFAVKSLPKRVYYHTLMRTRQGKVEVDCNFLPYPAVQDGISLVSFAPAQDYVGKLGDSIVIADSAEFETEPLLRGKGPQYFSRRLIEILRRSWEQMMERRGFPVHPMANNAKCFYFRAGFAENNRIHFTFPDGKSSRRDMVGFKTMKNLRTGVTRKRFWHFGIQAKPFLTNTAIVFAMKSHVLFSDDGQTIWQDKDKLARARRNQCKNWWNDEWRDRLLATAAHLSSDDAVVHLPISGTEAFRFSKWPEQFVSPVSYLDPDFVEREDDEETHRDYAFEDEEEIEDEHT